MNRILYSAALLLTATFTAHAQDATPAQSGPGSITARVERRLQITPDQRAQIKAILNEERPALQQLHTQLAAERTELNAQTAFNPAQIRAIAAKYAETNSATLVEHQKLRSELLGVLTPEQRQRLAAVRSRIGAALDARLETLGDNL